MKTYQPMEHPLIGRVHGLNLRETSIRHWCSFCKASKSHSNYLSYEPPLHSTFPISFYARDGFHRGQLDKIGRSADCCCIYFLLRGVSLIFWFTMRVCISWAFFRMGTSLWMHFLLFTASLSENFKEIYFKFVDFSFFV